MSDTTARRLIVHRMFEPDDLLCALEGVLSGLTHMSGQCGHWMVKEICEEFGCEDTSAILQERKTMPPLRDKQTEVTRELPARMHEMPYMQRIASLGGAPVRAWYDPRVMRVFVEGPSGRRFSLRSTECGTFVGQAHMKALRALYGGEQQAAP